MRACLCLHVCVSRVFSRFFQDRGVQVLAYLFAEAAKLRSSEADFRDSLVSFALPERTTALLLAAHQAASERVRARLVDASVRTPHYAGLEWRLDVELASRSLRRQTAPTWLMKLTVEDSDGKRDTEVLQTDATNLAHLYHELSMAFAEERAGYAKRISRNVK